MTTAAAEPGRGREALILSRLEARLPVLLSIIAGMTDLTGYFQLGNLFTAHITGNLVMVPALLARGEPVTSGQILAIPVFILGVAAAWALAKLSRRHGPDLVRVLLAVQFLFFAGLLVFAASTNPGADPQGRMAAIAAILAVCAIACQFTMLQLAMPGAPSTAVMTGNLTKAVCAGLDRFVAREPAQGDAAARLINSLYALLGFLGGCVIAAFAVAWLGDWAWLLPTAVAGAALLSRY